jgi:hypothetical protein
VEAERPPRHLPAFTLCLRGTGEGERGGAAAWSCRRVLVAMQGFVSGGNESEKKRELVSKIKDLRAKRTYTTLGASSTHYTRFAFACPFCSPVTRGHLHCCRRRRDTRLLALQSIHMPLDDERKSKTIRGKKKGGGTHL